MHPDITSEIEFQTARSGGKGGQNVNKVETMVQGRWKPAASRLFSEAQLELLLQKLAHRLTNNGELIIKSQAERSQSGNKALVIKKFNALVSAALTKKKSRIATRPTKASAEKRIEQKKQQAGKKQSRQKFNRGDF